MRIIRTFVDNPVAANMLMFVLLVGGLVAAFTIPRELFPEFSVDIITVTVPYPGAPPADIEQGICRKIEDYVGELEGIDEVQSTSREGIGMVMLEVESGADVRKALDDVKSEIDKIAFPLNAEDPIVRELTLRSHVIQVAVSGRAAERTLKELAEDIKEDLTDLPEISQVSVIGVRDYEIHVEVREQTLRSLGIKMSDVARAIQRSSFDLPAGQIKTDSGEFSLRIVGQKYTAKEYRGIPVLYKDDATVVFLSDIATIREGFEDVDTEGYFNGQPAALIGVFKTADEDALKIAEAVRAYIEREQPNMPEGITLTTWSDLSRMISDRLDMLVRNGLQGLVLVMLVLWLFLGLRMSFWVAMGIPVSILGAIMVMYLTGQTLNMMSMFALIMALGLIVDDAIVVGENVYSRYQLGDSPADAAVTGTRQVIFPVVGAVCTTWLAFVPLMVIPGIMGRFIIILPVVVVLTLAFSLLECLSILPSHLAHSLSTRRPSALEGLRGLAAAIRTTLDRALEAIIFRGFARVFRLATRFRYVTLTLLVVILVLMAGAYTGGLIKTNTFPKMDSDTLQAQVVLPTGTPLSRTREVARKMTEAALSLNSEYTTPSGKGVVRDAYTLIGQLSGSGGVTDSGGHVAEVIVELMPLEQRGNTLRSEDIKARWRQKTGSVPDAVQLTFGAFRGGPGGKPFEIRVLSPTTDEAKRVAEKLKQRLSTYTGVSDVDDDALPGKMELQITPRRAAYAYQIDLMTLGDQLRDAFQGNESIEVQRGRDEVTVRVSYPQAFRQSLSDLERMRIQTAGGDQVPFGEVADITQKRGYTTLRRVAGRSVVTVSGDIDEELANAEQILNELEKDYFFKLMAESPETTIDLQGQRAQQMESLGALKVWFPIALIGIFAVLAVIFKSYAQPVIVMVAIPFGLIGAVVGHWLLGFDVTLLSMFGMVALAGIVVNDSLVLIDRVNIAVRDGEGIYQAAETGACRRFRPIILTTVTTVAGMTPLLLERSFQAQFLKPMAVSIAFGLVFATTLTLIAVPCLYLVINDIRRVWRWAWDGRWLTADQAAQSIRRSVRGGSEQAEPAVELERIDGPVPAQGPPPLLGRQDDPRS